MLGLIAEYFRLGGVEDNPSNFFTFWYRALFFTFCCNILTRLQPYTSSQAWVVSTVVKMTLKTFEECVRLQTFNRSGYQQIQLDVHYLRDTLRDLVDNGTVIEIMLDEVSAYSLALRRIPSSLWTFAVNTCNGPVEL